MAPIPEQHSGGIITDEESSDDAIVVSGVSTIIAGCNNLLEFEDTLYKKEMVSVDEVKLWSNLKHPELIKCLGKIGKQHLNFDPQYFMVHPTLAHYIELSSKKLLEHSFQAVFDAGICPTELWGQRVGVFISAGLLETERFFSCYSANFGLLGCNRTMFANRISYYLNLTGPSYTLDASCCGSIGALEKAVEAIRTGVCDSAIVGSTKYIDHPQTSIVFNKSFPLSPDGKVRSYDEGANGQLLSEAVNVIYLQKQKDAKRIYARVCHVKCHFDVQPNFQMTQGPFRHVDILTNFLENFYREAGVCPSKVEYVDGFGAAIPEADRIELEALGKVLCKRRTDSLLVGSVASNIGYTESTSGLSSIMKLLLAYQRGELAGNVHCENPRQDVEAIRNRCMQILTDNHKFNRTYTAVNSLSLSGLNGHILLQGMYKPKEPSRYKSDLPYLVVASGRQESSVQKILDDIKARSIDPEEIALLHNIFQSRILKHLARGFGIYSTQDENTVTHMEKVEYYNEIQRPLWFVYSGMGSQWAGMGTDLMKIPVFAAAIQRCHKVLESKGLDLTNIITSPDETIFDNILNCFVGIAAIQIGLTDVLKDVGLVPDHIIGHSVGEAGCAYADGCFTAEEMILMVYNRGLVSIETTFIKGSMAAVGQGYKQISKICPPEIDVACHNSPNSCTISGPIDIVSEFTASLKAQGIFAKEVKCANIPYHSRYIAEAGPKLLAKTSEVITNPKLRSERWISTSVPQSQWNEPAAKYSSAEYHTNNLLSPVLFEEMLRFIPSNAVIVEVAPFGLLQAILKRSLSPSCEHIPLMKRGSDQNNVVNLFDAIGRLYMNGYQVNLSALYPKVDFPVSTATRTLAPMVEWYHKQKWGTLAYLPPNRYINAVYNQIISIHDDEYAYLDGHSIEGKRVYPFAAALILTWELLGLTINKKYQDVSVIFQNIKFFDQPPIYNHRPLNICVSLQKGSGRFEVTCEKDLIADGYIFQLEKDNLKPSQIQEENSDVNDQTMTLELDAEVIYKLLNERGYNYRNQFKVIKNANLSLDNAMIKWNNDWTTFVDGIFQTHALRTRYHGVTQPHYVNRIVIDIDKHMKCVGEDLKCDSLIRTTYNEVFNVTSCGGLVMEHLRCKNKPVSVNQSVSLKTMKFAPFIQNGDSNGSCNGEYYIPTFTSDSKPSKSFALTIRQPGDLNTLTWEDVPNVQNRGIRVLVHYAALNTIDAKRAIGSVISNKHGFGMDYSGVTEKGDRVMGIIKTGAANRIVYAHPKLLWPVPEHWSLEDAATVPLAYAHAFYCLVIKAKIKPGTSILIHGGAGALGQAAISIALEYGCEIFTTVSDTRKMCFLKKLYPQLKDDHIMNSRDGTFRDIVLTHTKGVGCKTILSCVRGDLKDITLKCCSLNGIAIDTEQLVEQPYYDYGMWHLYFRHYMMLDFSSLLINTNNAEIEELQMLISEGITRGYVRPLSRITYSPIEVPRAFRLLSESRHMGRVLLRLQDGVIQQPTLICNPKNSQLIISNREDSASQLTDLLVKRGAKKIHIHCENISAYLAFKKYNWQRQGVLVQTSSEVLTKKKLHDLLEECNQMGDTEDIFVIATDTSINSRVKQIDALLNNLDKLSRKLCPNLRQFVIISDNIIGRDVIISRSQSGLPSLMMQVHLEQKRNSSRDRSINETPEDKQILQLTLDTLDKAMFSKDRIVHAFVSPIPFLSILEEFSKIPGVTISNATSDKTRLNEIGIDFGRANEVCAVLKNKFNILLSKETLQNITLGDLNNICQNDVDLTADSEGFGTYFNVFEQDELNVISDYILMPTLIHSSNLRSDELDSTLDYLCIVPGLEGHYGRFDLLCERLKIAAVVLQPGIDELNETIPEMAQRLVLTITKKLSDKEHYYLVGYEFGVMVVLEMANILEKMGRTCTIFLLGGTPRDIQQTLDVHLKHMKNDSWENALITHMYTLISGEESSQLESWVQHATSWQEKLEIYFRNIRPTVRYSSQYITNQIETAYRRIRFMLQWKMQLKPLNSKIIILRAMLPIPMDDLKVYSNQDVTVYNLEASLMFAPKDLRCATIINKSLSPEILKEFDSRNHCETSMYDDPVVVVRPEDC